MSNPLEALDSETLEAFLRWGQITDGEVGLDRYEENLKDEVRDILRARVEPHVFKPFSPSHYVCAHSYCDRRSNDPIHV